jgi:hypothetical protein
MAGAYAIRRAHEAVHQPPWCVLREFHQSPVRQLVASAGPRARSCPGSRPLFHNTLSRKAGHEARQKLLGIAPTLDRTLNELAACG